MGHAISSNQHAVIWWLAQHGDAVELNRAIERIPPELRHAHMEYKSASGGLTPLMVAVQHGHVECVRTLLATGVNVNRTKPASASPLHMAAKGNYPEVAQLLVENATVNCNAIDQRGCTPLLVAAIEGHVEVLDVLLHCGAVDLFACKGRRSGNDVLTLARKAYAKAGESRRPKYRECLELITTVLHWCCTVCTLTLERTNPGLLLVPSSACWCATDPCTSSLVLEGVTLGSGQLGEDLARFNCPPKWLVVRLT